MELRQIGDVFFLELKFAWLGHLFFVIILFLKIFCIRILYLCNFFLMFLMEIVNDRSMMKNFEVG